MRTLWRDLHYSVRMLAKSRAFTALAVLTLAIGIGANTAIFSYLDALMIKPLPFPQAYRLMIFESHDKKKGWTGEGLASAASFLDFQKLNTSFDQIALLAGGNFNLTGDGPPELVEGGRVSWNYSDALGARPILGRTFTPDEDSAGAAHVAILSQGLWQSRFGGDPKIIGRDITIGGEPYSVVGVMPAAFHYPLMGISNLWTPLALTDQQRADRSNATFNAFGRLRSGHHQADDFLRRAGHVFGRNWDLWRDGPSGFAANPRDRNPDGAGRESSAGDAHGHQLRTEAGIAGSRCGSTCGTRGHAGARDGALPGHANRFADVCWGGGAGCHGSGGCVLPARAARHARGSVSGLET